MLDNIKSTTYNTRISDGERHKVFNGSIKPGRHILKVEVWVDFWKDGKTEIWGVKEQVIDATDNTSILFKPKFICWPSPKKDTEISFELN